MITGIEDTCRHSVRGIGRTIFPADVFRFLDENLANPLTGEVDLLMAYQALLKEIPTYGVFLENEAFELGTVEGYKYFAPKIAHRLTATASPQPSSSW